MSIPYRNVGPVDCTVAAKLENLESKSVIVTGGSSGLGAAYVESFLAAGAYVTNADIQPSAVQSDRYQYVHCDVRSWENQLSVFKNAMKSSPNRNVDIVVANAGISGISGGDPLYNLEIADEPIEPDLKIININFIAVTYTAKLALHYFAKSDSSDRCLILKSSMAGYLDGIGNPSYQCSKFAVRGLMCNLRRSDLCRVNLISPLAILTPIMKDATREHISAIFHELGSDWALISDAVKAVLRVAADNSINGRCLAIVPRIVSKDGYMDIEKDDFPPGSELERWQNVSLEITRRSRVAPPKP